MLTKAKIQILSSASELFEAAANQFASLASQAIRERGRFAVALAGGSTPRRLYSLLASDKYKGIPWDKIAFFFGDERHVPPDDRESNYRMANEALLSRVPVPSGSVFRIPSEEKDAETAALAYEQALQRYFTLKPGELPRFDLILLGLGPDGHTASLFPNSRALEEKTRLVVANWVEKFKADRITFTYPVLNAAANVTFLVSGKDKAATVREVFENSSANLPSQKVQPTNGVLLWMMDEAAAKLLSPATVEKLR
jgi:6-phosphogluconolactonase